MTSWHKMGVWGTK